MGNPSGPNTGQLWSGVNTGGAIRGLLIGQGTNPVAAVDNGTAGQVLTSNGANSDPTFQATTLAPFTFGIDGYFETLVNTTYPAVYSSAISCTISNISIKLNAGTCTASVTINGTPVTGLGPLALTTASTASSASGANAVNVGDKIGLSVSNTASATGLQFTIAATRP